MNRNLLSSIVDRLTIFDCPEHIKSLWIKKGFEKVNREKLVNYWEKRIKNNKEDAEVAARVLKKHFDEVSFKQRLFIEDYVNSENPDGSLTTYTESELERMSVNDICWVMTCYNELEFVEQAIASVRRNDIGPIVLINDGGSEEGLQELADKYKNIKYVSSNQLKLPETGGKWWKRFFSEGIISGCNYVVKIDPDTYFWRPLTKAIPRNAHFFGTVGDYERADNGYSVQGGIQGFSKKFIRNILKSKILDRLESHGNRRDGSFSTDMGIAWVAQQLDQKATEWKDVWSVWAMRQDLVIENPENYAIIHPVGIIKKISLQPKLVTSRVRKRIKNSDKTIVSINGYQVADNHVSRITTCRACDYFDIITGFCQKDNVYIYPKTKIVEEKCPIDKW